MKRLAQSLISLVLLTVGFAAFAQSTVPPVPPASASPPASIEPAAPNDGYVLGPQDVIEVAVLGQPEYTTRTRIRTDGTVPLPYIGVLAAQGKTALDFAREVTQKLKGGGYYANPVVNVEIVSYASRYVVVLGEVNAPGLQPVDRAYRLSEIIARAGGIRQNAADYVVVRKDGGNELRLPYRKVAMGGSTDDPYVAPGDKIYVPAAETFYIYGQVNAPGAYPIQEDMTLRKALARAGGLTPMGSEKQLKLFHDGKRLKVEMERPVAPGDVIVVGERFF